MEIDVASSVGVRIHELVPAAKLIPELPVLAIKERNPVSDIGKGAGSPIPLVVFIVADGGPRRIPRLADRWVFLVVDGDLVQ